MLEQMYNDFVTKALPVIQEGLVITKDYFFDLFGRYVKYLIVMDSIWLAWWLLVMVIIIVIWKKFLKQNREDDAWFGMIMLTLAVGFGTLIGIFTKTTDLVKDLYVPEIRVYQELKPMIDNHNNQK